MVVYGINNIIPFIFLSNYHNFCMLGYKQCICTHCPRKYDISYDTGVEEWFLWQLLDNQNIPRQLLQIP